MAPLITVRRSAPHTAAGIQQPSRLTTKRTHDARTLKALADDATFRPRFTAAALRDRNDRANTLPVATITTAGARPRAKRTSTMRTVRISVPSRKRQHAKLRGGARVDRAVHALERAKLTKLLAENKLVKNTSNAPDALLRSIATGVFQH